MPVVSAKKIQRNKNWKVIIYGKAGVGKTTAAKFLKGKTLILPLDNSAKVLANEANIDLWKDPKFDPDDDNYFDREHPIESIVAFFNEINSGVTKLSNYNNLFIDNVSSFEDDWFVERGRKSKNGIANEIQDYGAWKNYFSRIMTSLYLLPNVNVVTTAWEEQRDLTTESGQTFNQYAPEIRDKVRDGLLGLADVVGRVFVNPKTGGRGAILEGNDAVYAKNRIDDRKFVPIEKLFGFGEPNDSEPQNLEGQNKTTNTQSEKDGLK